MGNPVMNFEIAGSNGESLSEFYSSMFGWDITYHNKLGFYTVDPVSKSGIDGYIQPTTNDMPPNYITIYIEVDDLEASLEKAESLGGEVCVPPQVMPGDAGSYAMFLDPSGNRIGLYELKT